MATSPPAPGSSALRVLRVLLDTNVVLDWLLDRKLWSGEDAGGTLALIPATA